MLQVSDRIESLGPGIEVLLDDRESKYFDFRLDGINGIFRVATAKIEIKDAVAAARKHADCFMAFGAADIVPGEKFSLSTWFSGLPYKWSAQSMVAWYSMPYAQGVRGDLQMDALYKGRINNYGLSLRDRQFDVLYFFRDI